MIKKYEAPEVVIEEVQVEMGFALSNENYGDIWEDGE